ncbi:MAG: hypothetical protein NTZ59_12615 [Bacteroidetes bacterium]|nr:hypothetical protein [Bacteroidota bacterium]
MRNSKQSFLCAVFLFIISFASIYNNHLNAQTADELIGRWKMEFKSPNGTLIDSANKESMLQEMVNGDKLQKTTFGMDFSTEDSINSVIENSKLLRFMTETFLVINKDHSYTFTSLDIKTLETTSNSGKYEYNKATKQIKLKLMNRLASFTLSKTTKFYKLTNKEGGLVFYRPL